MRSDLARIQGYHRNVKCYWPGKSYSKGFPDCRTRFEASKLLSGLRLLISAKANHLSKRCFQIPREDSKRKSTAGPTAENAPPLAASRQIWSFRYSSKCPASSPFPPGFCVTCEMFQDQVHEYMGCGRSIHNNLLPLPYRIWPNTGSRQDRAPSREFPGKLSAK